MKKKILLSTLLISALTPAVSQAFGSRDVWVSGWSQGVSEFVILGKGPSQLYLTCEDTWLPRGHAEFHRRKRPSGQDG